MRFYLLRWTRYVKIEDIGVYSLNGTSWYVSVIIVKIITSLYKILITVSISLINIECHTMTCLD